MTQRTLERIIALEGPMLGRKGRKKESQILRLMLRRERGRADGGQSRNLRSQKTNFFNTVGLG